MLKAICVKCGMAYYGWSLSSPTHQICSKCGGSLDIIENSTEGKLPQKTDTVDYIPDDNPNSRN